MNIKDEVYSIIITGNSPALARSQTSSIINIFETRLNMILQAGNYESMKHMIYLFKREIRNDY